MFYVLDHREGDIAVLVSDGQQALHVAYAALPPGAAEGAVLRQDEDGRWCLQEQEQAARAARIEEKMQRLLRKD